MEQLGFWNVHFVTVDLRYFAFQESIIFFFMVRFDIMTGTCGIICHEGHYRSHVYVSLQPTTCVSAPIIGTVCQGIGSGQESHNRHIQSGMLRITGYKSCMGFQCLALPTHFPYTFNLIIENEIVLGEVEEGRERELIDVQGNATLSP